MKVKHMINTVRLFLTCEVPFDVLKKYFKRQIHIPHALGILVSSKVKIGKNIWLYPNVAVVSRTPHDQNKPREYPTIEDDVILYTGSIIIGGVTIGHDSIIGANTTVMKDIPPNSVAYGNPLVIKKKRQAK